jgi:hypothetical protein
VSYFLSGLFRLLKKDMVNQTISFFDFKIRFASIVHQFLINLNRDSECIPRSLLQDNLQLTFLNLLY